MKKGWAIAAVFLVLLAGCEGKKQESRVEETAAVGARPLPPPPVLPNNAALSLTPLSFSQLPGWREDDPSAAIAAFLRSCASLARRPAAAGVGPEGRYGRVIDWRPACDALGEPEAYDASAAKAYFETWFQPYLVGSDGKSEGLFTGYYEVEVRGALERGGPYQWPLYALPRKAGLAELDRASIERGALEGRGLEIAWLDDPVDVFDLHIQGSAVVKLPDGSSRRIGFGGTNGLPFVGVGRLLLDRGLIGPGEATAQGVKAWLQNNGDDARAMMRENPRYTFFRWIDGNADGPIGAQGVPLTAGRSLAIDPSYLAYGLPLFLESSYSTGQPLQRLFVAQDTGGAIKGPVRGDIYWGTGEDALAIAGGMKQQGRYYLFLPRTLIVAALKD